VNRQRVRAAAIAVLAADVVAVLVTVTVVSQRPDPAPVRHTVVDARCIDRRITQGIDTATPGGLIAYDTGVTC
jgi:hypothetical protein